jgi:hypothetical protein
LLESVAVTVNDGLPAAVGVPEIVPAVLKERPAGSDPEVRAQVIVPAPPVDCNVVEYAVPTTPLGTVVVVMVRVAAALTAMLSCCVTEEGPPAAGEESVAFTVRVDVATVVGVPAIVPEVLKESPAGSDPEARAHVIVPTPPVACKVDV